MRRTLTLLLIVLGVALAGVPWTTPPAHAEGATVSGAGSTWSQIAVDQWRADVRTRYGININYSGVGSSAGRQFFLINSVDFAVSEIPFLPDEKAKLDAADRSFQYLPIVAGGTALMYNLQDAAGRRITNLRLSTSTIAGIFTGRITNWNDPAIAKENGGRALPSRPITPVVRSDGSGTSAQFSAYLAKMASSDWRRFASQQGIAAAPTSNYPQFGNSVAQRGSDGVANFVANSSTGLGSIGYVETGYAIQRGFPVAAVKNASGNYALPTAANVATALTRATLNRDQTQNLDGVYVNPAKTAYPISSYSYMITQTDGFNADKGRVLTEFMYYFACAGQQKAAVLGYSPLPPNLVQVVFDAIRRIPGAIDVPSSPTASNCPNPTLTGDLGEGATAPPPGTSADAEGGETTAGSSTGATTGGGGGATTGAGSAKGLDDGLAGPGGLDPAALGGTVVAGYREMEPTAMEVVPASGSQVVGPGLAMVALVVLPPLLYLGIAWLRRSQPWRRLRWRQQTASDA
jgi:phosphate transport system substrate-binding protein